MPFNHFINRIGIATIAAIASSLCLAQDGRFIQTDPRSILTEETLRARRVIITSIADMEAKDVREAPANVQVITAKQMQAAGVRDLTEALQLVPGISLGRDVDDAIGVALHGNWAEEGKCLFLLNGTQLNENDFGTYTLGQRIPLDNVERIEVIIGPGSIVHGGFAALGVVNIVTYTAEQQVGSRVSVRTSATDNGIARSGITVSGTHRLGNNQEIGYLLSNVGGQRSNAVYDLPDGTPINLRDSTSFSTSTFQFNYRWKEVKASMSYLDETFDVSDGSYTVHMRDVLLGVEQSVRLGERGSLQWRLTHADQLPWYYMDSEEVERLASNTTNQRTNLSALSTWKPTSWLTIRGGLQAARQHSAYRLRMEQTVFRMNDRQAITMEDLSGLMEATLHGRLGNLTAGHRIQHNSLSGMHTAPRIAYSKVVGKAHLKAMWSEAFRIPTVMNLNYGPDGSDVTAERITTLEGEIGLQLNTGTSITINAYNTRIANPIVYVFDEATLDNYLNRVSAGSEGIDARILHEHGAWLAQGGLGLNQALADADLPEAQLPVGTGQGYQGLPTGRAFVALAWTPKEAITARLHASWRDRIWSYQVTSAEAPELVEWPELWLVNAGLSVRPDRNKRWSLDVGCNNLFDQARPILSPFNNVLIPFRANGREWTATITYRFVQ